MGSAFSRARCHMSLTASGICSSLRNIGYKELPSSQYHKPQLRMTLNLNHYNYLGNVSDVAWISTPGKRQDTLPGSNAPFHWMPMPASWIRNHPNRRWNLPANLYNQHFHKLPENPETNIAPENGWLEDYFPFKKWFPGRFYVTFTECKLPVFSQISSPWILPAAPWISSFFPPWLPWRLQAKVLEVCKDLRVSCLAGSVSSCVWMSRKDRSHLIYCILMLLDPF